MGQLGFHCFVHIVSFTEAILLSSIAVWCGLEYLI